MVKEILLVERDEATALEICTALGSLGVVCSVALDVRSVIESIKDNVPSIFLSIDFSGREGAEIMERVKSHYPDSIVVAVVRDGDRNSQLSAISQGAFCCLTNPSDLEELKRVLDSVWREKSVREELSTLKSTLYSNDLPSLQGRSRKMAKVIKTIELAVSKDTDVLLAGERGVGKELIARHIHNGSVRKNNPFVTLESNIIPKELHELVLFGSNTRNILNKNGISTGIIYHLNGGTLYVDEITNLNLSLQEKLLQFLRDRDSLTTDDGTGKPKARIIAATQSNLKDAVAKESFNEKLFERLKQHEIKIPPIRERKDDILDLVKYFIGRASSKYEVERKELSKSARKIISAYTWPGNVGELQKIIYRAVILSKGTSIEATDLMMEDNVKYSLHEFLQDKLQVYLKEISKLDDGNLYDTIISEVEKSLISIILKETDNNQLKASKILGINRNTLRNKIKQHKILMN